MTTADALMEIVYGLDPVEWLSHIKWDSFDWQRDVLHDPSTRICINGARQAGKSTIISAKACHMAKYRPGSLTVILAPTQRQSQEDMLKIRSFYGPDATYPKRVKANDMELVLDNGSRVLVLTATDEAARGFSNPDLIIFDEASRIPDIVFDAVRPMITNNDRAVIVEISTPNGRKGFFNSHFHSDLWSRYEVRAPWDIVTTATMPTLVKTMYEGTEGVKLYFSPRHYSFKDQIEVITNGEDGQGMSSRMYRQEYCCEFVEAEAQVFSNELIANLFGHPENSEVKPFDLIGEDMAAKVPQGEASSVPFPDVNDFLRRQGCANGY